MTFFPEKIILLRSYAHPSIDERTSYTLPGEINAIVSLLLHYELVFVTKVIMSLYDFKD